MRSIVAFRPKASSSSGTGGTSRSTILSDETITMKRSAAAATAFSRVWAAAAALDDPAGRIDLVGAVDGDVEPARCHRPREGVHPDAEVERDLLGRRRRRHAVDVERPPAERRQQIGDGGAGAEPDDHPVLDELGSGIRRDVLLPVKAHAGPTLSGYALSGCCASVKRSPCAAPEPAFPPPEPRSTNANATASAAPTSGPAT